jgi:hypothetical protein
MEGWWLGSSSRATAEQVQGPDSKNLAMPAIYMYFFQQLNTAYSCFQKRATGCGNSSIGLSLHGAETLHVISLCTSTQFHLCVLHSIGGCFHEYFQGEKEQKFFGFLFFLSFHLFIYFSVVLGFELRASCLGTT